MYYIVLYCTFTLVLLSNLHRPSSDIELVIALLINQSMYYIVLYCTFTLVLLSNLHRPSSDIELVIALLINQSINHVSSSAFN